MPLLEIPPTLPWAASSTQVLLWLVSEMWDGKTGLGTHQGKSARPLPGLECPSSWHLWVAARAAADQELGEKGSERGHRYVSCTQADGTGWIRIPSKDSEVLQRCLLHLALLLSETLGAGAVLCFRAGPALVLSSVEGLVHSEKALQLFLSRQCRRENHQGRVYHLMGKFLAGVCSINAFVHVAIAAKM